MTHLAAVARRFSICWGVGCEFWFMSDSSAVAMRLRICVFRNSLRCLQFSSESFEQEVSTILAISDNASHCSEFGFLSGGYDIVIVSRFFAALRWTLSCAC